METLSFTLRVPSLPAGTRGLARVVAYQEEREVARSEVGLLVLPRTEIALAAPATLEVELGGPFEFPVYVTNRSNQREEVLLEAEAAMAQVLLSPPGLSLAPGETGVARVLASPQGQISAGYRFYLKLRATPKGKAEAGKEAGVIVLFRDPLGRRGQGRDPELTLGLALSLALGATWERGQWQGQLGYQVAPSLFGALSDYVTAAATPDPLSGDLENPLRPPQTLTLSLKGEGWEARAQGGGEVRPLRELPPAGRAPKPGRDLPPPGPGFAGGWGEPGPGPGPAEKPQHPVHPHGAAGRPEPPLPDALGAGTEPGPGHRPLGPGGGGLPPFLRVQPEPHLADPGGGVGAKL